MTTQDKIAAIIDDLVATKGELDGLVVLISRKDDCLHLRAEVPRDEEADLRVVLAAEILRHLFDPRDTDEQTLEKFGAVSEALVALKERNNGGPRSRGHGRPGDHLPPRGARPTG